MKESILFEKSRNFAIEIIYLYKRLSEDKREYVLSKQVLRSGTSIGANISEARFAQSLNDFISKMSISLKEANETYYWIDLLMETGYIDDEAGEHLRIKCLELIRMLQASVKTSKGKL
ncbi:four helix bundle protein [Gudongella oleilytica]|uniref:four helix bundle protein n=1 Tax=Gudongella oleilytica TaxID=1582259 RepID=UPI000FF8AA6A|nr:four helix bundle protein [Gudongella oleilytica]